MPTDLVQHLGSDIKTVRRASSPLHEAWRPKIHARRSLARASLLTMYPLQQTTTPDPLRR
jgi:hypothetical protein